MESSFFILIQVDNTSGYISWKRTVKIKTTLILQNMSAKTTAQHHVTHAGHSRNHVTNGGHVDYWKLSNL